MNANQLSSVMVTGGIGAIGSWVVDGLVKKNIKAVVIDEREDFSLLSKATRKDVVFLRGSILDLPFLSRVAREEKIDAIVHLAALMIPATQANPYWGYKVNIEGTMNIFEVARTCGCSRVIYASSRSVYGNIVGDFGHPMYQAITEEGYPRVPCTVYGATKLSVELLSENYRKGYKTPFIGLRFPAIYGPGRLARHGAIAISSKIIENAHAGIPFDVPVGGDQRDDLLYVKDAARGIFLALMADNPLIHGIYNIGSGRTTSLKEMATVVRSFCPRAQLTVGSGLNYQGFDHQEYSLYDFSRAKEYLRYTPQYSLNDGIKDYLTEVERMSLE
jgi:UDP-glucose 4-epimerase